MLVEQGMARVFAKSYANIIFKNRLVKNCLSAIDWLQKRCETVRALCLPSSWKTQNKIAIDHSKIQEYNLFFIERQTDEKITKNSQSPQNVSEKPIATVTIKPVLQLAKNPLNESKITFLNNSGNSENENEVYVGYSAYSI